MVRDLWRTESFGRSLEAKVLDAFPDTLTRVDHRYRMERALLKDDWESAGRAAGYAGGTYASLVRARRAVEDKSSGAAAALAAVPPSLRSDASYIFSRAQYFRRADKPEAAAAVLAAAPGNPDVLVDGDEWWIERRIVARKLLDLGDARTAYAVASQQAARTPEKRIEAEFHAGWIALRFAGDPAGAAQHFAGVAAIAESPISVARAAYGRAGRPRPSARARRRNASTSARPSSRSPITARWPGRDSARPACPCGRRPTSRARSARPSTGGSTSAPCACSARPGSRSWRCRSTSTPPGTCRIRANCRRSATSPPT